MNIKKHTITVLLIILTYISYGQDSKWRLNLQYGLQHNFFVDYGKLINYDNGYILPVENAISTDFIQKKPLGTQFGFSIGYVNKKNTIYLSYDRSENVGTYNGSIQVENAILNLVDYDLRHINNYFSLTLKHDVKAKNKVYWSVGWYFLNPQQEEIEIIEPFIVLSKRTAFNEFKNAQFGFLLGVDYIIYANKYYNFGVNSTYYHTLSTAEPESFLISPFVCFKL